MAEEDWRVEVELDDEEHGYSVAERLRARDLDDEAKKRLGQGAVITRDGSKLFAYTTTGAEADAVAGVLRELLAAEGLTGEMRVTRWHPVEEAWEDAAVPLPATATEEDREREQRDERERVEVETGGEYEWRVHVRAPDRGGATALGDRLRGEGLPVERRWHYLTIGALNEEDAGALASRIQAELPAAEIEVGPTLDLPSPSYVLIRSWF